MIYLNIHSTKHSTILGFDLTVTVQYTLFKLNTECLLQCTEYTDINKTVNLIIIIE